MRNAGRLIHARTDSDDRLISADEPLAGMQARAGGTVPGQIAAPALLELVRRTRAFGLKLARTVEARDEKARITAWADVTPSEDGGCDIILSNWYESPLAEPDRAARHARRAALAAHDAGLSVRLGREQEVLAVDCEDEELAGLAAELVAARGKAWTDAVELDGIRYKRPAHWRLLDCARVRVDGSARN